MDHKDIRKELKCLYETMFSIEQLLLEASKEQKAKDGHRSVKSKAIHADAIEARRLAGFIMLFADTVEDIKSTSRRG